MSTIQVKALIHHFSGQDEKSMLTKVKLSEILVGTCIFSSRFFDAIKLKEQRNNLINPVSLYRLTMKMNRIPCGSNHPHYRVSLCIILLLDTRLPYDLYFQDVVQAQIWSRINLSRSFFLRPPEELRYEAKILKVTKSLYSVPEAGNDWFNTYQGQHTGKLYMTPSKFNPFLLQNTDLKNNEFGLFGVQTDDKLLLANSKFT